VQFVDYVRKLQQGRAADLVAFVDPLNAGGIQCNAMDWSANTNATRTMDSVPAHFKALERNLSRTAQPYMPIVARINRMRVEFMQTPPATQEAINERSAADASRLAAEEAEFDMYAAEVRAFLADE
jgi:hypothetical protein